MAHELNGKDPDRVRNSHAQGRCRCADNKEACHRRVPLKQLQATCVHFWDMEPEERAHVMRALYAEASGPPPQKGSEEGSEEAVSGSDDEDCAKVQWFLCGQRACFSNFACLLGTSEPTVRRQLAGMVDGRAFSRRAPVTHVAHSIDFFFYELYHSAAEPLPDHKRRTSNKKGGGKEVAVLFDGQPWLHSGDPLNPDEPAEEDSINWDPDAPTVDSVIEFSVAAQGRVLGLPRRYLPHSRLHDLYWLFVTSWEVHGSQSGCPDDQPPPSYSSFKARYKLWKRFLKIRGKTQFAQCQTCWELMQAMNDTKASWAKRSQAARDLKEHYRFQYWDRCIYWSLRWASRAAQDVLCLIIDSLTKTRLVWPRWEFDRVPKWLEGLERPTLTLTASIAHGWCTAFYLADEMLPHGANAFAYVLCDTIERVYRTSRRSGRPFPKHLVVISDNTVAQAKNETAFLVLAIFVARYKFITANIFFLMVGHTHEDVDQLFALVLKIVVAPHRFETPQEFLDLLREALEQRVAAKGEELVTARVQTIPNFDSWVKPMGVSLDGCFATRNGTETPHAFSFKLRQDLSLRDRAEQIEDVRVSRRRRNAGEPSPLDVMCCIKTYMRDTLLQQSPELSIPHGRIERLRSPWPTEVTPMHPLSDVQIESYLKLSHACQNQLSCPAAAKALHELVNKRQYSLAVGDWFAEESQPRHAERDTGHPHFPHLPAASWRLHASFSA